MTYGRAIAIMEQIESEKYTVEEKGLAIHTVLSMETTNGVKKDTFKKALNWMWHQLFTLEGEAE